MSKKLFAGQR